MQAGSGPSVPVPGAAPENVDISYLYALWGAAFALSLFHWTAGQSDGPETLPATPAELPRTDRKPYPGWTD